MGEITTIQGLIKGGVCLGAGMNDPLKAVCSFLWQCQCQLLSMIIFFFFMQTLCEHRPIKFQNLKSLCLKMKASHRVLIALGAGACSL